MNTDIDCHVRDVLLPVAARIALMDWTHCCSGGYKRRGSMGEGEGHSPPVRDLSPPRLLAAQTKFSLNVIGHL